MYTSELENAMDQLAAAVRRARQASLRAYEWPLSTQLSVWQEEVSRVVARCRLERQKELLDKGRQMTMDIPPDRPRDAS